MAKRALIIDDDARLQALVTGLLESASFEVRGAQRGAEGLRMAAAQPPDVVILDVQMPGMDGYEVCRILRNGAKTRHIPIVMLTASDDPALNRKAYAAGAQACVPKPFRREGLLAAVEVAMTWIPRADPEAGRR